MRNDRLTRLDEVASLSNAKVTTSKNPDITYVGLEHLPSGGSKLLGFASAGDSISTNGVFRKGDVLFGKLRPRLRKSIRAPFDGYCSTDILVLRPTAIVDPVFAAFILQSDPVFDEAIRTEEGTKMPRCSWSTLREFRVYCPSNSAQQRIAEILSTVDEAIEQTEALIAKTQQIKAGLMHDLFTRGVTADGRLRPPREEAPQLYKESPLGWIPKKWEVSEFGLLAASATLGTTRRGILDKTEDIPLLKMGNLDWGGLRIEDVEKVSRRKVPGWESLLLRDGDLLFNTRNTPELVGKTAAWRGQLSHAIYDNNILRVRFCERMNGVFLSLWMGNGTGRRLIGHLSTGTTSVAAIYWRSLKRLPVPVLHRVEQNSIVTRIDAVEGPIRVLQSNRKKLEQLKSGLMQDLLTGRVPVSVASAQKHKEAQDNV